MSIRGIKMWLHCLICPHININRYMLKGGPNGLYAHHESCQDCGARRMMNGKWDYARPFEPMKFI